MNEQTETASKLRRVAATLASERILGWANPLIIDITEAADLLDPPPNHWRRWAPAGKESATTIEAKPFVAGEIAGLKFVVDDNIPRGEVHARQGRQLIGKIINVKL